MNTFDTAGGPAAVLDLTVINRIRDMERRGAARLLQRLIDTWLATAAKLVDEADRAIERADANALRHAAHTLKSSSGNLGAGDFATRCGQIEALARDGRLDEAKGHWSATRGEYERVVRALKQLAAEETAPANG